MNLAGENCKINGIINLTLMKVKTLFFVYSKSKNLKKKRICDLTDFTNSLFLEFFSKS